MSPSSPVGSLPLVGGSSSHVDASGGVVFTSRVVESYPYARYFMSQSRAKLYSTEDGQPQAFLQDIKNYMEEWNRKKRELGKKVEHLNSQMGESACRTSAAESDITELKSP